MAERPVRLQLSRRAGFDLQALSLATNGLPAVKVDRSTGWGNPYRAGDELAHGPHAGTTIRDTAHAVAIYAEWAQHAVAGAARPQASGAPAPTAGQVAASLEEIRGHNLACWCAPGAPCHADVLLGLANRPVCDEIADPTPAAEEIPAAASGVGLRQAAEHVVNRLSTSLSADRSLVIHADLAESFSGEMGIAVEVLRAALAPDPVIPGPGAGDGAHLGWLFHNPDTGTEWSASHPVESGECDGAEGIRPATVGALHNEMLSAWGSLDDERRESEARRARIPAEVAYANERRDHYINEAQRLALLVRELGGDPEPSATRPAQPAATPGAKTYSTAEMAALRWLAEQPSEAAAMPFVPENHGAAMVALGRRTGRDKPLSVTTAAGGFRAYALREAGRAALVPASERDPEKVATPGASEGLREALAPFAACVFNDNGEVTVTTSGLTDENWLRAYRAHRAAIASAPEQGVGRAAQDVLAERRRQIEVEGWTPEHDDTHSRGELACAAACYATEQDLWTGYEQGGWRGQTTLISAERVWPWSGRRKPADRRRNLVKAGALILADIDRLDRAAPAPSHEEV